MMDVEEYLSTSFEEADCEFLDGEVVERNTGELPHSKAQTKLIIRLGQIAEKLGLQLHAEVRIQISPRRFRVADVAVWRAGDIGSRIPTVPPFLAIEILSAEDRMVRMLPKIQEYVAVGVEYVWLIDPVDRKALVYSQQDAAGHLVDVLRTSNPAIELPLTAVFS